MKTWWKYTAMWRIRRWIEKVQITAAWLMPKWLVYWCSIRLISSATTGKHSSTIVPELTAMDALQRWEMV